MTVPRSIDIHFSHSFAVDGPGHAITPAAGLVWFGQQSSSDATALIVDQKLASWEHDGVIAGTTRADSTGVLAGFLYDITTNARDQELGLLQVDMEPLTFHATCIEKLPWHTCVELTWKHFQRQDEEQWAKYRVLMHTNSHAKLAVLTIDTDTIPCIGVRILDEMDGLFLNTGAPQAHHRTFIYTPFAKSNGRFFSDTKINMMASSNLHDFWWVHKMHVTVHVMCKIYWIFALTRTAPGF